MGRRTIGQTNACLPKDIISKRVGNVGLIVGAGISCKGKTKFVVVNGNLNEKEYVNMLDKHFLAFIFEKNPGVCVFRQNNSPAYSAKFAGELFMEETIFDLEWTPKFADLNKIENAWWELERHLYTNGRQFDSI